MIKKEIGVTLLEILLVLAIASSIMLMGVGQYQRYKTEQNFAKIKTNVDQLFQAMSYFYQTNCSNNLNRDLNYPLGTFSPGQLAPIHSADPVQVAIPTLMPTNWPAPNPVVDDTDVTDFTSGYTAQFIPKPATTPRQIYNCTYYGPYPQSPTSEMATCSSLTEVPNSQVLIWNSQIAVKIRDPILAAAYQTYAHADCLVDEVTPGTAVDCTDTSQTSATSQFLVWQRLPSFSSPELNNLGAWALDPTEKQFKVLYTHDPMYDLYAQPTSNYLCGG